MFYSKPPRAVGDLFGVLDNHSPFVFSSSHFEKQNEKKKISWKLIRRTLCLGTGDESDVCRLMLLP